MWIWGHKENMYEENKVQSNFQTLGGIAIQQETT